MRCAQSWSWPTLGERYVSSSPSSAACRYASAAPAHQMSPFGFAASALTCASISPVAFCTTATFVPVAFSNPTAMPWHHAVFGELQYRLSCAAAREAASGTSAQRSDGTEASSAAHGGRFHLACEPTSRSQRSSSRLRSADDAVLREVVVDELDVGDLRRQRRHRRAHVRRQLELLRLRAERLGLRA